MADTPLLLAFYNAAVRFTAYYNTPAQALSCFKDNAAFSLPGCVPSNPYFALLINATLLSGKRKITHGLILGDGGRRDAVARVKSSGENCILHCHIFRISFIVIEVVAYCIELNI